MAFSIFGIGKNHHETKNEVVEIPLDQIEPNRYQPRQVFNKKGIQELAETINAHGLLQPIILREYEPAKYEIIAGERRYRAMKLLNWEKAPAIVEKMNDHETASLALIENLQRSELSSVEEAQAYEKLMDLNNLTQAKLAKGMGKSQSAVANKLRLLKLIVPVQNAILDGLITERHGRALLNLNDDQQRKMLMRIVNEKLNVRQTEDEVARLEGKPLPSAVEAKKEKERLANEENVKIKRPKKRGKHQSTKKAESAPKIKISDPRIAMNTIKESVKMINDSGLDAELSEQTLKNAYKITIKIPKQK
ncbi:nucleoid occlusion protein [uncultured Limosilactobacillus sp.]|uniref:nucleoid occlusion protein n=1 Tax=uncultured Limosilactobacillus sp. TaxID=2837629 RepID=UPI0025DC374A|nr:nucleoid occlusion protein [uncultured Limosilactobacillus sp.]